MWGRTNDDCDMEVKEVWQLEEDKVTTLKSLQLHNEPCSLWIGDDKISTQVRATLYNHIHDLLAMRKGCNRGWDGRETFD
jgi:hypothetical protein